MQCPHMLSHPKDSEGSWSGAGPLSLPQGISQAGDLATEPLVLVKGKVQHHALAASRAGAPQQPGFDLLLSVRGNH